MIHAPIRSVAELGSRVRLAVGPVSAEITTESLARLGLRPGQPVYASFKATGTRVVAETAWQRQTVLDTQEPHLSCLHMIAPARQRGRERFQRPSGQ